MPQLTGANNFQRKDGSYVGLPISVQGVIIYYNKDVYTAAGSTPMLRRSPGTTWRRTAR